MLDKLIKASIGLRFAVEIEVDFDRATCEVVCSEIWAVLTRYRSNGAEHRRRSVDGGRGHKRARWGYRTVTAMMRDWRSGSVEYPACSELRAMEVKSSYRLWTCCDMRKTLSQHSVPWVWDRAVRICKFPLTRTPCTLRETSSRTVAIIVVMSLPPDSRAEIGRFPLSTATVQ